MLWHNIGVGGTNSFGCMLYIHYVRCRHRYAAAKRNAFEKIVSAKTVQTAEEKYNAYIETYGEDDSSALCLAKYYMKADEADKSRSMLFKLKNKTSIDYYRTMTEWYNKFDKGNFSYVVSTLLDAVAEHPSWAKGHLMLGLSYYETEIIHRQFII